MAPTLNKTEVDYRDSPRGRDQCNKCTMFREPDKCTLVKGLIKPYGWCRRFDPEKGLGALTPHLR